MNFSTLKTYRKGDSLIQDVEVVELSLRGRKLSRNFLISMLSIHYFLVTDDDGQLSKSVDPRQAFPGVHLIKLFWHKFTYSIM